MESAFPLWNDTKTEIDNKWVSDKLKVDCVSCKLDVDVTQVKGMSGAAMVYMKVELASGQKLPIVVKETHSQFAKNLGLHREAMFYEQLQSKLDIKTPKVYYQACDE